MKKVNPMHSIELLIAFRPDLIFHTRSLCSAVSDQNFELWGINNQINSHIVALLNLSLIAFRLFCPLYFWRKNAFFSNSTMLMYTKVLYLMMRLNNIF